MPNDEPFEYLATQVIADFLATRRDPELDGIIYRSAQATGAAKHRVWRVSNFQKVLTSKYIRSTTLKKVPKPTIRLLKECHASSTIKSSHP